MIWDIQRIIVVQFLQKKTQELDNELKKLYDEETEKKENEIRLAKEKNLRFEYQRI